jgi:hypothetical protein
MVKIRNIYGKISNEGSQRLETGFLPRTGTPRNASLGALPTKVIRRLVRWNSNPAGAP